MAPRVDLVVLMAALLAASLAQAAGQARPGFMTVGEDPAGDASSRVDIVAVELRDEANDFFIELNLSAPYGATSSVMYAVHFSMWGTNATVCWNPQAVNQSVSAFGARVTLVNEELPEDVEGCNRFDDRVLVAPTTREDGVEAGQRDDGFGFVRWTVNKLPYGGGALIGVTDLRAETWSRGINGGGAGSDTIADYVWVRQDRAPDEGIWSHSFTGRPFEPPPPPPPASRLDVAVGDPDGEVRPGSTLTLPVAVAIDQGQANVTFRFEAARGISARFDPPILVLSPARPQAATQLTLEVPADARGELVMQVTAASDGGIETPVEVRVPVSNPTLVEGAEDASGAQPPPEPVAGGDEPPGVVKQIGTNKTPGPAPLVALLGVLAAAAFLRRRR